LHTNEIKQTIVHQNISVEKVIIVIDNKLNRKPPFVHQNYHLCWYALILLANLEYKIHIYSLLDYMASKT